eukprot:3091540-Pleurochrysis_carterae.AAC.3
MLRVWRVCARRRTQPRLRQLVRREWVAPRVSDEIQRRARRLLVRFTLIVFSEDSVDKGDQVLRARTTKGNRSDNRPYLSNKFRVCGGEQMDCLVGTQGSQMRHFTCKESTLARPRRIERFAGTRTDAGERES